MTPEIAWKDAESSAAPTPVAFATSGWLYDIGFGEVRISDDGARTFRPVIL